MLSQVAAFILHSLASFFVFVWFSISSSPPSDYIHHGGTFKHQTVLWSNLATEWKDLPSFKLEEQQLTVKFAGDAGVVHRRQHRNSNVDHEHPDSLLIGVGYFSILVMAEVCSFRVPPGAKHKLFHNDCCILISPTLLLWKSVFTLCIMFS